MPVAKATKENEELTHSLYFIRNIKENAYYIGISQNPEKRFRDHKSRLASGKHENTGLLAAYQRLGADAFVYSIVEVHKDRKVCEASEVFYISRFKALGYTLYNQTPGGIYIPRRKRTYGRRRYARKS